MLGHGISSAALFLLVGFIYDSFHTKIIWYFFGMSQLMPIWSFIFCIFSLSNISLPLTMNFLGEFLILVGMFEMNSFMSMASLTTMVLSVCYNFWLFNSMVYTNYRVNYLSKMQDMCKKEFFIFMPLMFFNFFFGIYSENLIDYLFMCCKYNMFTNIYIKYSFSFYLNV